MSLIKSTTIVSFFTLLSRISGLIRDMVMIPLFGASQLMGAFLVAFKIPNFMRRLFAEGSFSLAFVPVLNDIKATGTQAELKQFIDKIAGSLIAVVIIVWMIMELLAPQILTLFAYKWFVNEPMVFNEGVSMLRTTLFYLPLISLVALSGGILNAHNKFALPAATPILLNISLISCAFFLKDYFLVPERSLAVGVLLAGILQLLVQIPFLVKMGLLPRFKVDFKDSEVKRVMKLMVPTLFGSSIAQINLLLDTLIATMLPIAGSVTFLYLSDRLVEFPLGVFAIAISTVILPTMSRQFAKNKQDDFVETLKWALTLGFLIAIPASLGLFVLAKEVIVTLFQYAKFSSADSAFTSFSLMAYMFALPAFILNKILLPAFYARKDTKTPVRIGIVALFSNMFFNVIIVGLLWYLGYESLHVGLALAGAVSGWIQTVMLYKALRRCGVFSSSIIQWQVVFKIGVASLLMVLSIVILLNYLGDWSELLWYWRLTNLVSCLLLGVIVYASSLWVMGVNVRKLLVYR